MPMRPPSPCRFPGCAALVEGTGYCEAHASHRRGDYDQTTRRRKPELARAARIRSTSRWRIVREHERHKWPICCDPFGSGCRQPTAQINHIEPLASRPDLAYVEANHAPVCTACHARVSAKERRGEDTVALFADWQLRYLIPSHAY